MKDNGNAVEVKQPKQFTTEEFAEKFQALCDEMGYQLIATPVWVARDDGTFSMKINWSIGNLPKIDKRERVA